MAPSTFLILNSRGMPHKAPILGPDGRELDESVASARCAVETLGVDPAQILLDSWSVDTIGNAYFALLNHVIPLELKKILIVTSEFHMPRSKLLFDYIFSLAPGNRRLSYIATANTGLSLPEVEARERRELVSISHFDETKQSFTNLKELSLFIFSKHQGYCFNNVLRGILPTDLLVSY